MNWYKFFQVQGQDIQIDHRELDEDGQSHPQGLVTAYDRLNRMEAGYLHYSVYNNKLDIDHVQVLPVYQRRGIATMMVQELLALYPQHTLMPQLVSSDGAGLFKSLRERGIVSQRKSRLSFAANFPVPQPGSSQVAKGYKIVGWNGKIAYSLYSKQPYDIALGAIHRDVFMGTTEQFCIDYYSGGTDDHDMMLTYEYNTSDVTSGDPFAPNGEVRVRQAKLVSSKVLPDMWK